MGKKRDDKRLFGYLSAPNKLNADGEEKKEGEKNEKK